MRITETQRLLIDEATAEDAPFFFLLMNTQGWLTYIGNRNIHSEKEAAAYIADKIIKSYAVNGFGLYTMKLKQTDEPIGTCGFIKRDYLLNPDLGFAILPGYEGNGYMKEAAESLMNYGFRELAFEEILAITHPANSRSQRLLYKLGFQKIGDIQPDKNQHADTLFSVKK